MMFDPQTPVHRWLRRAALFSVISLGLLSLLGTGSNTDPGLTGFADAGYDQEVESRHFVELDGSGTNTPLGADPADDAVTYFWEVVAEPEPPVIFPFPATYELENANRINPRFMPLLDGEYVVRLRVRWQGVSDFDTVSIFASDAFIPPTANAGPDRFVKHGSLVALDGSGSLDWDWNTLLYDELRYSWFIAEQPEGSNSALSATDVVNPTFVAEYVAADTTATGRKPKPSRYRIRLHAIDSHDMVSKPDHADVYVYPPEGYAYPVPVTGPRQTVKTGSAVTLDGSGSFDVDGRPLTYVWEFYSQPPGSTAVLANANTAVPSFTADVDGVYVAHLTVSNGERTSVDGFLSGTYDQLIDRRNQDRAVVYAVSDNADAVGDAGADRVLPTNTLSVPLDGSNSYDPEGDPITYRWFLVDAPDGSSATIDNPTDTVADSARLLTDLPGSYVVGLQASFGEHGIDQTVITLTDNSAPTADAGEDQTVIAGDTVQLNSSASSDAEADPLGYSWSLVSAPGDNWEEEWPALSDGMVAGPTFSAARNGEYLLQLIVNDGQFSSTADPVLITASGSAVNTAPVAAAGADQSVSVGATVNLDGSGSSDADSDPLTYTWSIEIRPLGSVAVIDDPVSATPSFVADVEGSYEVQLIVNDGLENSAPDTMTVTAVTAGACANPLTLTTSLPFAPNAGELPTNVRVDADGPDTLSAVAGGGLILDSDVYQARLPDGSNLNLAEFVLIGSNWEEISRSHPNPIDDSLSPSFVVRQTVDNIYYKINVDFTGTNLFEVQIDGLSGCRCGNDAADCPL